MAIYVWYSPATDVTGKKIQEALKATGGTAAPPANATVLCWGTKKDENIVLPNKKVFNHPNNIRKNRDKLAALKLFKDKEVSVASFTNDMAKAGTAEFPFPLVLRTKFHQGGAGFWLCLNKDQVDQAVKEGAQYMQNYIHIKDEYRLHIVDGKVVYAVKKVQRDNHKNAFVEHYKEYVETAAGKKKVNLDADTITFVLDKLAGKFATGADMIIRSNTRGWKFSKLDLDKLNKNLSDEAVKALKALGLDYGAVDCCITADGSVKIIECNSGPGLDGSSFDAWIAALKEITTEAPAKVAKAEPVAAPVGVNAPANAANVKKKQLKDKITALGDMVDAADTDEEVAMIEKLFAKMQKKKAA